LRKAVHNKEVQKYYAQNNNNWRKIDAAKVNRYFYAKCDYSNAIEDRFCNIMDKINDRIIGIGINPGKHGPCYNDPHVKIEYIVKNHCNSL
jgi:hypothetical protein